IHESNAIRTIASYLPRISSSSSSSSSFSSAWLPTIDQKKRWTLMLLQMAVEMNISFRSLTECEVLKKFFSEELGWQMPSRWTLSRLLPVYYSHLMGQLKNELRCV